MCVCGGTEQYKKGISPLRLALHTTSSVSTLPIERTLVLLLFYFSYPSEPCGTHPLYSLILTREICLSRSQLSTPNKKHKDLPFATTTPLMTEGISFSLIDLILKQEVSCPVELVEFYTKLERFIYHKILTTSSLKGPL